MNQLTQHKTPPAKSSLQHDYILLDGSSSMLDKWWESLEAIDAYIASSKANNVNSHVILTAFASGELDLVHRNLPIADWIPLLKDPIGTNGGMTPLYDAVNVMCRRLRDLDPPRCSIVIVTDGEESGSEFTTLVQAKAMLDWCRAKGWQVTFIGADFSNAQQASLLGGTAASSIGVQKKLMSQAAANLGKKRAAYGTYGTPMHFTEGERQQFGGYLNAPGK